MGKTGRNFPCPYGSGKKYKKCCLPKHEEEKCRRLSEANVKAEDRFEDRILYSHSIMSAMELIILVPSGPLTGKWLDYRSASR